MASATVTLNNRLKLDLARGNVDFSADAIKGLLVRSGFVFNQDAHHNKVNFKATLSVVCSFSLSTITVASGGLSLAGFISGMVITGSGNTSYGFSYICTSATDTILYFAGSASWVNGTSWTLLTCQDEVLAGNGYSQDAFYMSGISINEDDASDIASITWTLNYSITAVGGSIGPTPGLLLIDDAKTSTIIGYISLASAEMIGVANALVINGVIIRLT